MAKTNAAAQVERGTDELDFLGSRQRTVPREAKLARAATNDLVQRVVAFDSYSGGEAHDQGTTLIELYMTHADQALGFRSWRAFVEAHWPLDVSLAYERMRVAKLCTRRQALEYGFAACQLGLRIMAVKEIATFAAFRETPLARHPDDGGGVVRFPAPANDLRSVLRALAVPTQDERPDDLGEKLRRYRTTIEALLETDPGIAAIRPVVWADVKGAYVRVTTSGPEQAKAAVRLYQRLARLA